MKMINPHISWGIWLFDFLSKLLPPSSHLGMASPFATLYFFLPLQPVIPPRNPEQNEVACNVWNSISLGPNAICCTSLLGQAFLHVALISWQTLCPTFIHCISVPSHKAFHVACRKHGSHFTLVVIPSLCVRTTDIKCPCKEVFSQVPKVRGRNTWRLT